jgi:hypothetical protein
MQLILEINQWQEWLQQVVQTAMVVYNPLSPLSSSDSYHGKRARKNAFLK